MRKNLLGCIGEIDPLPGCHQVAVSHSVFLPPEHRGKGTGTAANLQRQWWVFEELGYDLMLCTVVSDNVAQKRVLSRTGWSHLTSFKSRRTGHVVEVWACRPKEKEE